MSEFKWNEMPIIGALNPLPGMVVETNLPVQVIFRWSDEIVEDVDEFNVPVSYRSGFIMEVLPNQTFVYENKHFTFLYNTTIK